MPLARLAQYQHCLLRRNGVRTGWMSRGAEVMRVMEAVSVLKRIWNYQTRSL
jgi:hypothetical protein